LPTASDTAQRVIPMVMDGAHVPFNIEAVLRDITRSSDFGGKCVAVVALASDKDARGLLTVLSRYVAYSVFTEAAGSGRAHPAHELEALATSMGITCQAERDPRKALDRAVTKASGNRDWILVTGSLYLVGALRSAVLKGAD
jgi:dihydrofolate synthase/folylpolyglutamate synthase